VQWRVVPLAVALVLTPPAVVPAGSAVPALPAEAPAAVRARLAPIVESPSLARRVHGASFVARRDVFEFLLDHPEFTTHVTRALKLARYRIWQTPTGLMLDDGWGTVGVLETVYAAPGIRVMYLKGEYQHRLLPSITGHVVVRMDWTAAAGPDGKSVIAPIVAAIVKLDNRLMEFAVPSSVAANKADKEANRLVRLFAKTTRALDDDATGVLQKLRTRPDTPRRELEEFAALLSRPAVSAAPTR
jgi:hypothetical protein